jgi:hypothetical protein
MIGNIRNKAGSADKKVDKIYSSGSEYSFFLRREVPNKL